MVDISACIVVKNAKDTIRECLNSLREFNEVIILDNGSIDDTIAIANEFSNVCVFKSEFIGFGPLKNLAISYAKNDWILSIDSDEILEYSTLDCIKNLKLDSNIIYALPRKNLYNGKWIKACGWYPDYVYRIFNKNHTRFNNNIVHESVIIQKDSIVKKLDQGLRHYAFRDINHLIDKLQYYSTLWAEQNTHKSSSPLKSTLRSIWSFLNNYLFKKGILYGYEGFVISVCNALGVFFKYMKLYENKKMQSAFIPKTNSLIVTTYNQKERLSLVLDSIKNLQPLPSEVLIADDGSKEDTRELIESYMQNFPCRLKHIWQEDIGFRLSEIRNKAIKAAIGEYIIIVDGDMILESHFIQDHLIYAKRGVFLQGSRVILDSKQTQEILDSMDYKIAFKYSDFKATRLDPFAKFIYLTSKLTSKVFNKNELIKGVRGCNMSFYKSDCEAINGFNEDFIGWGREDSEFVARFLFNNGKFHRIKFNAIAYHLYHQENTRTMLESNHLVYLNTIKNKLTWCKKGITI